MKYLLLVGLLWLGGAGRPAVGQRKPYPHFRPTEKRNLRHYKPKTWRERAPEPKPPATPPALPR